MLPTIRALAERNPTIKFELMARADLARFAERRMVVSSGHSLDRREVALLFSNAGSTLACRFFGQFDRIDCFFASDDEHFCVALKQATAGDVHFYPFRPEGIAHAAECYLWAIGANSFLPVSCAIDVLPEDLCHAHLRLEALGLEARHFLLMLPGSGSMRKNWAAENFAVLAERVSSILNVLIVLGPAENALAPFFRARSPRVVSDLELAELSGIAHLARCFIGNDSGVSHLAAASGARGLVIFGPTDPGRWRPLGDVKIIKKEPLQSLVFGQVWSALIEFIDGEKRDLSR
jgi:heptosyltransferase III